MAFSHITHSGQRRSSRFAGALGEVAPP